MDIQKKTILINAVILATLGWYYWRGTSLLVIGISAAILLVLANASLILKAKTRRT